MYLEEWASVSTPTPMEEHKKIQMKEDSNTRRTGRGSCEVASFVCDVVANLEAWGDRGMEAFDGTPGVLLVKVRACVNACH